MKDLEKSCIQFDYFSSNYKNFEEDFYKFATINIPLTFFATHDFNWPQLF